MLPRKAWGKLTPGVRKRKLAYYKKTQGLNPSEIARRYNSGTLGSQTAARGHAATPEHPHRATLHPDKYREYIKKRQIPEGAWQNVSQKRRDAHSHIKQRIGHYTKYSDATVQIHCFYMMTDEEVEMTLRMDTQEIIAAAGTNLHMRLFRRAVQSPWWYHAVEQ
jgi:hypothetical protein